MTRPESADFEKKSEFSGTDEEWLELIKVVVSMANTRGGSIEIARLKTHSREMDSARIDDKVNKYVKPRIAGISSRTTKRIQSIITVENSGNKPHLFKTAASYVDRKGRHQNAFYPGQFYGHQSVFKGLFGVKAILYSCLKDDRAYKPFPSNN